MATIQDETFGQWSQKYETRSSPAQRDFRSDTVTLPSAAMLTSIMDNATALGDDVYGDDGPTKSLERYVSELTGMPHSLFVMSGTMGNQIAVRCHLAQPPHSIVLGDSNHIFVHEAGMASMFSQAQMIPVPYKLAERSYLTLEDVEPHVVPDDGEIHSAPTKLISLENTWRGRVMPVAELRRVTAWAHERGIKVHLDGARLWNACYPLSGTSNRTPEQAAAVARETLREYCAAVDSVSMCFSKSLGAPVGSVLCAHSPQFIAKALHVRKALGGGTRQVGILTAAARTAIDEVFLSGIPMPRANAIAKELADAWRALGGREEAGMEQETNMVWLDLAHARVTVPEFKALLADEGLLGHGGRIVTHWQISDSAIASMKKVLERAIRLGQGKGAEAKVNGKAFSYAT